MPKKMKCFLTSVSIAIFEVNFNPSENACTKQSKYCVIFFPKCRGSSHAVSAGGGMKIGPFNANAGLINLHERLGDIVGSMDNLVFQNNEYELYLYDNMRSG